jgi:hypothetical protein
MTISIRQPNTRARTLLALLVVGLAALLLPAVAAAQNQATELERLAVELWPDYDQPAMLVLLTGTLPPGQALPADVVIPIPAGAEINAVARFNDAGVLVSDVQHEVVDGRLIFTTPASRFRVEYYAPYEVNGDSHSYSFTWLSDVAVNELTTVVQQPVAAEDIAISPAQTLSTADRGDSLTYHSLPVTSVASGQPYAVDVSYTVTSPQLSAAAVAAAQGEEAASNSLTAPSVPPSPAAGSGGFLAGVNPWLLAGLFGLMVVVGAGAWYLGSKQGAGGRPRKPGPARPASSKPAAPAPKPAAGARYCHACGTQAQPGDAFCRSCGTKLKA